MAVIVGPTSQDGVESLYQLAGSQVPELLMIARTCRMTECMLALEGLISSLSRYMRTFCPRKSNPVRYA